MNEIWKDIPTYEGKYQVSNLGRVKSLNYNHAKEEKVLTSFLKRDGYMHIGLYNSNKRVYNTIHQLVAMAFLGHTPCGFNLVIDHINDIKTDNRLENLQIVTQRFNTRKTRSNYSSKYKGVGWHKRYKKWTSRIIIDKQRLFLGYFTNEHEAHLAYENKLKQII